MFPARRLENTTAGRLHDNLPAVNVSDVGLGAPLGGRPLEAANDLEPGATY